ncbi:hypothetical protein VitviT2T_019436 [Vitis vinifera]|uniref:aminodeoxychorismate synthase n=2 Tax=Vitis vinifera TaxID=29760 RepID=A0ABY9D2Z4_VITVI|nr:aminodeoxychorismate synthase, chloroplastic [Vitis vinifera]WKA01140.1 hypothetical protein VitviT2T_019436 [Vitis vinifera]|eukprot:XP_002274359.2 PREDICTED: aminodeoxychorismate synthase, chloroplastic [Vitis vinifera]
MESTRTILSSELKFPCFKGLHCRDLNEVATKSFLRVKKDNVQVSKHQAGKSFVSSLLVPAQSEGLSKGKKQLEVANGNEIVRTLLIDNYDSYTYNVYQELSIVNGVPPVVVYNDDLTWEEVYHYLYEEKAFDNVVISPGPGTPSRPEDIGICLRLLRECKDIPILGVCLGYEALGHVHGAEIVHAPEPIHGRLSELEHNGCSLFDDIPSGPNSGFKVVRYHSLVIDAKTLSQELVPIAWTSSSDALSYLEIQKSGESPDAYESQMGQKRGNSSPSSHSEKIQNGKILMGIMHCTRPHYGVQFHPESIGTAYGRKIFKNFREITQDYWLRKILFSNERREPRSIRLFKDLLGHRRLVHNAGERRSSSFPSLLNLSLPSSDVKFLNLEWRKFNGLAGQVGGSRNIFCELFGGNNAEYTFWLDSASTERGRFSFMGAKGGSLWKQFTFRLSHKSDTASEGGGHLSIEDSQGSITNTFLEGGFLEFLNKELLSIRYDKRDYEGLPFAFHGGYVGYLGYDLKVECGAAFNRHKSKTPDACFFFADNIVVIDHHYDDVYILSLHEGSTATPAWLDETEKRLLGLKASDTNKSEVSMSLTATLSPSEAGFLADKSMEQYMKDVKQCLQFIKDGESYELCLTSQLRKRIGEMDLLDFYLHLREKNPAPFAAWLNFPKEKLCICSSSPERFLKLDENGMLEAKPIKGTVPRGSAKEADEQLKQKLQCSEKDQAENLMIVDLLRNNLGRVCEVGSVHVPLLMDVESYTTVHTMVSTIRGKKDSTMSPVDCVRAAFPGGSMTGAPKLRSMELLDSIESSSRGIYSGSIGFFSYNQTFDLNIVIRTVVIHEGEASVGAGGAIIALSDPAGEHEEMILKTRAPVNAVASYQKGAASNEKNSDSELQSEE